MLCLLYTSRSKVYWFSPLTRAKTFWVSLETVELDAVHYLPSGSVALYYLRPGQTEYSETHKVFARVSGENQYTFDLGGLTVTGLRIDPDSVGGVQMCIRDRCGGVRHRQALPQRPP